MNLTAAVNVKCQNKRAPRFKYESCIDGLTQIHFVCRKQRTGYNVRRVCPYYSKLGLKPYNLEGRRASRYPIVTMEATRSDSLTKIQFHQNSALLCRTNFICGSIRRCAASSRLERMYELSTQFHVQYKPRIEAATALSMDLHNSGAGAVTVTIASL